MNINDALLAYVGRVVQCQYPSIIFLTNTDRISYLSNNSNQSPYFSINFYLVPEIPHCMFVLASLGHTQAFLLVSNIVDSCTARTVQYGTFLKGADFR